MCIHVSATANADDDVTGEHTTDKVNNTYCRGSWDDTTIMSILKHVVIEHPASSAVARTYTSCISTHEDTAQRQVKAQLVSSIHTASLSRGEYRVGD